MENLKRKRELTRLRIRKHRILKTELNLNAKSPNEPNNLLNDGDITEAEQAGQAEYIESELEENRGDGGGDEEEEEEAEDEDNDEEEEEEYDEEEKIEADQEEGVENEEVEVRKLKEWIIKSGINFIHVDSLLAILRRRLLPQLPKSHKTFLQVSSATYNIEDMEDAGSEGGQFVYFGISQGLQACINEDLHVNAKIPLQINVDGIPIFKSSYGQFWPILCKVFHDEDVYKPFPIAIYFGASKPKYISQYLNKFVEEMNGLLATGIIINGKIMEVYIQCFICDTPARSMLKNIKGHTGFYSCERCTVRGYKVGGSTVFPSVDSPERTDESFRNQVQQAHHNGISPLLDLEPPVDMIKSMLLDSMHLFPLGITKKLLVEYWLFGMLNVRLGRRLRVALSERLEYLKAFVPCEFQRKPRAIKYVAKWKATELRFFLLYCGPIVLRDILSPKLYKHFLLLHVSYRILCSPKPALRYNKHAKAYLKSFFMLLREFYGRGSQIMNAHNSIHVADDVKNMKCDLLRISAFPFENTLGTVIKRCVRTPHRPLAQVCRRLTERRSLITKAVIPSTLVILRWKTDDILGDTFSIKKLKFRGFTLTTSAPENKVLLRTGEVLSITKMFCPIDDMDNVTIEGNVWKIQRPVYSYPCSSENLKMWELTHRPSSRQVSCNIHNIEHKMILLAIPQQTFLSRTGKRYIMPLLHTTNL